MTDQPPQPPPPPGQPPSYGQPPQYGQPPPPAPPQPAPPQYGQVPPAPAPQYGQAPPSAAPKKRNTGCVIAIVAMALFGFLLLLGVVGALFYASNKVDQFANDVVGSAGPCPYISTADATEALGTPAEATLFTGGFGRLLNITDLRVLPDQNSCILGPTGTTTNSSSSGLGRAVRYSGSDAGSRFAEELTKAKGVTQDRGGGLSVTSDEYFNKDVSDLGDEAFCTKSSGTLAGVLVRQGDTLVYVALAQASDAPPGVDLSDPDNAKLGTDDAACDASQVLARKILG